MSTWPLIDEAVSFPATVGSTAPFPFWISVTNRSINRNSIKRGRQYELDTVQTGEYTPTLDNRDAALSPVNPNGPWAANFEPYCAYRKRAMWPVSVNTLYQGQASGMSLAGISVGTQLSSISNAQVISAVPTTSVQPTPNAFRPGYNSVLSVPVSSSLSAGNGLLVFSGFTIWPGLPLSWQLWVCLTSGSLSLPVAASLAWVDATGAQVGSVITGGTSYIPSGSSSWVNVQLPNQTPPFNAAGAYLGIENVTGVSSAVTMACAAAQLEQSATCSAFAQPGVWY